MNFLTAYFADVRQMRSLMRVCLLAVLLIAVSSSVPAQNRFDVVEQHDDGTAAGTETVLEQERQEPAPLQAREPMTFADGEIINTSRWLPETRKQLRPTDLWQHYMHGVVDHFAEPIPFSPLFGEIQEANEWLDRDAHIRNTYKSSTLPAVRLTAGLAFTFERPLPLDYEALAGRTVRFFIWMQGYGTGLANDNWNGPPGASLLRIDEHGRTVEQIPFLLKTQGTFDWHCYYHDLSVAAEPRTSALQLRLSNRHNGVAWFSTLSYEILDDSGHYTANEKQDPVSGSLAHNPYHDELPYHFRWGKGRQHTWNFLRGAEAGLKGVKYDLTSNEGVRKYYLETARKDRHHLTQAVRYFADWYHYGRAFRLLPEMEDEWLENLAALIMADQDEETGFWGFSDKPKSMAVTWHYVDGLFSYQRIPRSDREDLLTPWHSMGINEIPRAAAIARTVLDMQSGSRRANGDRIRRAWPTFAYDAIGDLPVHAANHCTLASTSNAISLLRMTERYVPAHLQTEIYDAVRDAVAYTLKSCLTEEWLWVQSDVIKTVTSPAFMPRILGDSHYLERRTDLTMASPNIMIDSSTPGVAVAQWVTPSESAVAVRLYAKPPEMNTDALNESNLLGIIQRTAAADVLEMDPLLAMQKIYRAAQAHWNVDWNYAGPHTYLTWKLSMLPPDLPIVLEAEPLSVPLAAIGDHILYASAVSWYGEESSPVRLDFVRDAAEGDAETAEPEEFIEEDAAELPVEDVE